MSPRQTQILQLLQQHPTPTLREMASALGNRSTSTVRGALTALQRQGHITIAPRKRRGITTKES